MRKEKLMDDMNQLRLTAAEIIRKLWVAGETEHLTLLRDQATVSLEKPYTGDEDADAGRTQTD